MSSVMSDYVPTVDPPPDLMSDSCTVTLTISAQGSASAPEYSFDVYRDDEPVRTNVPVDAATTAELRHFVDRYLGMFEGKIPIDATEEALKQIGRELFQVWLSDAWSDLPKKFQRGKGALVIASDAAPVLNLPWELLMFPKGRTLVGLQPNLRLRRHPHVDKLPDAEKAQRPGPLRVLYTACQPRGSTMLDYEREEVALIRILSRVGGANQRVAYYGCDLGSFEELQEFVERYRPHVVHLTGHADVRDEEGVFVFEDEEGKADLISAEKLALDCLANPDVQCVFVSGCKSGQAPNVDAVGGICQTLVHYDVPMAVGWSASITDHVAIAFARRFYQVLGAGQPVDRALAQARRSAHKICEDLDDPAWTLPVLYASSTQERLVDASASPDPPHLETKLDALPGMNGTGYAEHFVGRRREIQRHLPALRRNRHVLLISGMGGMGKSTLATRLTQKLCAAEGMHPIAVTSKAKNEPFGAHEILDKAATVLRKHGIETEAKQLNNEENDELERLRMLVHILNDQPFVLVLDNLEPHLDLDTRETKSDTLRAFLTYLASNLTGRGRCIITSRYRPRELDTFFRTHPDAQEHLTEFPRHAFLKFILRDKTIQQRYERENAFREIVDLIYDRLGGTPRYLEQIKTVLDTSDTPQLRQQLETIDLPTEETDENELRRKRDAYIENIFVRRLYHAIEPEASRDALSRAAVYTIPMTAEGYAAAAGVEESDVQNWIREWQRRTFIAPVERMDSALDRWTVPMMLRSWLLRQLRDDEQKTAHRAAGVWLGDVYDADRESEHLGAHVVAVDLEARSRFLDAEAFQSARQITDRLSDFFMTRGLYGEVIQLNEEMNSHEMHPGSLNWLGRAYSDRSDYTNAAEAHRSAAEEAAGTDAKEHANALHGLATIALEQGAYEQARTGFQEALQIRQEIGDRYGEAATRHQLATILLNQGYRDRAQEEFHEVLRLRKKLEDWIGEAATRHNIASIALKQGEYDQARDDFSKVLELRRAINDRAGVAETQNTLATLALLQGHYDQARDTFEEALKFFIDIADWKGEAAARHGLASIALDQGNYGKAQESFVKVLSTRQKIGDWYGEGETWAQLGTLGLIVSDRHSQKRAALQLLIISHQIFSDIGASDRERVWQWIAGVANKLGYDQKMYDDEVRAVISTYQSDRGWSLLREAFPDADFPDDEPTIGDGDEGESGEG